MSILFISSDLLLPLVSAPWEQRTEIIGHRDHLAARIRKIEME